MTRHTIIEDFDNRDVVLSKGDIVILLENDRYGEKGYGGDKYSSGLEKAGGYYHVMVKTRHGRKVRIPRHILSKDCVQFQCQLCQTSPMSAYRDYVDHMIDSHLRVQLLRGLDMSKKNPACPFPSCHGISWPIVDNLLFHYASHHNVLEKVVMYESELAAQDMRNKLKSKEGIIESLARELEDTRKSSGGGKDNRRDSGSSSHVKDDIQGAREMRVLMEQLKEENESLKQKLSGKNTSIKCLKEDLADMKKDIKEKDRRYEQECRIVQSLKNELKAVETEHEACSNGKSVPEPEVKKETKVKEGGSRHGGKSSSASPSKDAKKEAEDGVSSSGTVSPSLAKTEEEAPGQDPLKEVKILTDQIEDLKAKVDSLRLENEALKKEIENLQLHNENLKNIIEIGKSTVETAKKISQELADDNQSLKAKETKLTNELKTTEMAIQHSKAELKAVQDKLFKLQESTKVDLDKISSQLKAREAEVSKLSSELTNMKENFKQEENSKILTELKRDEIKSKLVKCRENCRTIEESKKTLENDYRALLAENKNAASEIKTLKSHLSSSRAIVVEKAVTKDEIGKIKSELTAKTIEVEKANIKIKKLNQHLSSSQGEIKSLSDQKASKEAEIKELRGKLSTAKVNDDKEVSAKLKTKEEELASLSQSLKSCEDAKTELQERLDFYIQQCSVFEKNDSQHQEEILVLQNSIKTTTMDTAEKLDKYKDTIQTLENATSFYKGQVDNLLNQNETLRKEALDAKSCSGGKEDKNLMMKYKMKCDTIDELLKKQEKISAQLRRKDWEIENYQKKLDSAFESGMSLGAQQASGIVRKVDGSSSSQESPALDLTTRKKEDDTNNNKIKVEDSSGSSSSCLTAAERNAVFLRNRKYSELSEDPPPEASQPPEAQDKTVEAHDTNNPMKRSNPTAICGPEAKRPSLEPSSQDKL